METPTPWYQLFFHDDYLRMYAPFLPSAQSSNESEAIQQLLSLTSNGHILDLCCGIGRHSIPLAQKGIQVTALDLSPTLLRHARKAIEHQELPLNFIHADMRRLPFDNTFDAIINVFTSFGYLENEQEDQRVLQEVQKALKPGGLFLLENIHQVKVIRAFNPHGIIRYADGAIVLEERQLDLYHSRLEVEVTLIPPDQESVRYHQSIRLYTITELCQMFESAGLEIISYYGGLDLSTFNPGSRLVLIGRKPLA